MPERPRAGAYLGTRLAIPVINHIADTRSYKTVNQAFRGGRMAAQHRYQTGNEWGMTIAELTARLAREPGPRPARTSGDVSGREPPPTTDVQPPSG